MTGPRNRQAVAHTLPRREQIKLYLLAHFTRHPLRRLICKQTSRLSHLVGGTPMGEKSARMIEQRLKLPERSLDALDETQAHQEALREMNVQGLKIFRAMALDERARSLTEGQRLAIFNLLVDRARRTGQPLELGLLPGLITIACAP